MNVCCSFCRITGKARGLPKCHYPPLIPMPKPDIDELRRKYCRITAHKNDKHKYAPPIDPNSKKPHDSCRILEKRHSLESHSFLPTFDDIPMSHLDGCRITQHHARSSYNFMYPIIPREDQDSLTENQLRHLQCSITHSHHINPQYRYVCPVLDDNVHDLRARLCRSPDSGVSSSSGESSASTVVPPLKYVYPVLHEDCGVILDADLEEILRSGEVEHLLLSKDGSEMVIETAHGDFFSLKTNALTLEQVHEQIAEERLLPGFGGGKNFVMHDASLGEGEFAIKKGQRLKKLRRHFTLDLSDLPPRADRSPLSPSTDDDLSSISSPPPNGILSPPPMMQLSRKSSISKEHACCRESEHCTHLDHMTQSLAAVSGDQLGKVASELLLALTATAAANTPVPAENVSQGDQSADDGAPASKKKKSAPKKKDKKGSKNDKNNAPAVKHKMLNGDVGTDESSESCNSIPKKSRTTTKASATNAAKAKTQGESMDKSQNKDAPGSKTPIPNEALTQIISHLETVKVLNKQGGVDEENALVTEQVLTHLVTSALKMQQQKRGATDGDKPVVLTASDIQQVIAHCLVKHERCCETNENDGNVINSHEHSDARRFPETPREAAMLQLETHQVLAEIVGSLARAVAVSRHESSHSHVQTTTVATNANSATLNSVTSASHETIVDDLQAADILHSFGLTLSSPGSPPRAYVQTEANKGGSVGVEEVEALSSCVSEEFAATSSSSNTATSPSSSSVTNVSQILDHAQQLVSNLGEQLTMCRVQETSQSVSSNGEIGEKPPRCSAEQEQNLASALATIQSLLSRAEQHASSSTSSSDANDTNSQHHEEEAVSVLLKDLVALLAPSTQLCNAASAPTEKDRTADSKTPLLSTPFPPLLPESFSDPAQLNDIVSRLQDVVSQLDVAEDKSSKGSASKAAKRISAQSMQATAMEHSSQFSVPVIDYPTGPQRAQSGLCWLKGPDWDEIRASQQGFDFSFLEGLEEEGDNVTQDGCQISETNKDGSHPNVSNERRPSQMVVACPQPDQVAIPIVKASLVEEEGEVPVICKLPKSDKVPSDSAVSSNVTTLNKVTTQQVCVENGVELLPANVTDLSQKVEGKVLAAAQPDDLTDTDILKVSGIEIVNTLPSIQSTTVASEALMHKEVTQVQKSEQITTQQKQSSVTESHVSFESSTMHSQQSDFKQVSFTEESSMSSHSESVLSSQFLSKASLEQAISFTADKITRDDAKKGTSSHAVAVGQIETDQGDCVVTVQQVELQDGRRVITMANVQTSEGPLTVALGQIHTNDGPKAIALGHIQTLLGTKLVALGQIRGDDGTPRLVALGQITSSDGTELVSLETLQAEGKDGAPVVVAIQKIQSCDLASAVDSSQVPGMAVCRIETRDGSQLANVCRMKMSDGVAKTVAVGQMETKEGPKIVALGEIQTALGPKTVALGQVDTPDGPRSMAMGQIQTSAGPRMVALGQIQTPDGTKLVALSQVQTDEGPKMMAIGQIQTPDGPKLVALSQLKTADGVKMVAVRELQPDELPHMTVHASEKVSPIETVQPMNVDVPLNTSSHPKPCNKPKPIGKPHGLSLTDIGQLGSDSSELCERFSLLTDLLGSPMPQESVFSAMEIADKTTKSPVVMGQFVDTDDGVRFLLGRVTPSEDGGLSFEAVRAESALLHATMVVPLQVVDVGSGRKLVLARLNLSGSIMQADDAQTCLSKLAAKGAVATESVFEEEEAEEAKPPVVEPSASSSKRRNPRRKGRGGESGASSAGSKKSKCPFKRKGSIPSGGLLSGNIDEMFTEYGSSMLYESVDLPEETLEMLSFAVCQSANKGELLLEEEMMQKIMLISSTESRSSTFMKHESSTVYESEVQMRSDVFDLYVAIADYIPDGSDPEAIPLWEGQIVEVLDSHSSQKWLVRTRPTKTSSSKQGWVPPSYVEKKTLSTTLRSIQDILEMEADSKTDSKEKEAVRKRAQAVKELVETEEEFAKDMLHVVNTYVRDLENTRVPKEIRDLKEDIFMSFSKICDFHNNVLIKGVQYYANEPARLGKTFLRLERDFDMHVNYCRDEPKAQQLLSVSPAKEYFQQYSQRIGEVDKTLADHLKLPIQRINDYQLLLKELIKYSARLKEDCTDLQKALDLMLSIPQRASDLKFLNSIEGYRGNLLKLGRLLRHDWFTISDSEGKSKERYLFLFKARVLVCKVKRINEERSTFILKDIVRLPDVEIKDRTGDKCKFELHHKNPAGFPRYPLTLIAKTEFGKEAWLKEIREFSLDIVDFGEEEIEVEPDRAHGGSTGDELEVYEELITAPTDESIRSESVTSMDAKKGKPGKKPSFSKLLKPKAFKPGDSVSLECDVRSVPPATVLWLKDNVPLSQSDRLQFVTKGDQQVLTLKGAQAGDAGLYIAHAVNSAGTASSAAHLSLLDVPKEEDERPTTPGGTIMPHAPIFSIKFKDTELLEDSSVTFMVKVRALPEAEVKFFKDGKDLKVDDHTKIVVEDKETFELVISHIKPADAGKYTCVAKNSLGEATTEANVTVSTDKSFVGFTVGEEVKSGLKPGEEPTFTWYKDGQEFEASDRFKVMFKDEEDTLALVFQHVKAEDAGMYTCVAATTSGNISCSAELTVQGGVQQLAREPEKPKITAELTDTEVNAGGSAMLELKVTGFPKPAVTWTKDGKPVEAGGRFRILHEDEESIALVIKSVVAEDSGKYKVVAKNKLGESSTSANLLVKAAPTFKKAPKDVTAMVSQELRLEVQIEGKPAPEVAWFKDGQAITSSDRVKVVAEKDGIFALIIKKSSSEDSGSYSCVASNSSGKISEFCKVSVSVPPSFLKEFKNTECRESDNVKLEIKVDGTPAPTVTWSRDGEQLKADGKHIKIEQDDRNHYLIIEKVTRKESAKYSCTVTNIHGTSTCGANLTVNCIPEFSAKLSDRTVKEGDEDVKLEVKLSGTPEPALKWYIDKMEITEKSNNFKLVSDGETKTLIIKKVAPDCAGKITCQAKNASGEVNVSATLNVLTIPKFTEKLADKEVTEGDTVAYQVKITGNPEPQVKWYKNNQEVSADAKIKIKHESSETWTLTLDHVTGDTSGEYECRAKNSEGESVSKSKLVVNMLEQTQIHGDESDLEEEAQTEAKEEKIEQLEEVKGELTEEEKDELTEEVKEELIENEEDKLTVGEKEELDEKEEDKLTLEEKEEDKLTLEEKEELDEKEEDKLTLEEKDELGEKEEYKLTVEEKEELDEKEEDKLTVEVKEELDEPTVEEKNHEVKEEEKLNDNQEEITDDEKELVQDDMEVKEAEENQADAKEDEELSANLELPLEIKNGEGDVEKDEQEAVTEITKDNASPEELVPDITAENGHDAYGEIEQEVTGLVETHIEETESREIILDTLTKTGNEDVSASLDMKRTFEPGKEEDSNALTLQLFESEVVPCELGEMQKIESYMQVSSSVERAEYSVSEENGDRILSSAFEQKTTLIKQQIIGKAFGSDITDNRQEDSDIKETVKDGKTGEHEDHKPDHLVKQKAINETKIEDAAKSAVVEEAIQPKKLKDSDEGDSWWLEEETVVTQTEQVVAHEEKEIMEQDVEVREMELGSQQLHAGEGVMATPSTAEISEKKPLDNLSMEEIPSSIDVTSQSATESTVSEKPQVAEVKDDGSGGKDLDQPPTSPLPETDNDLTKAKPTFEKGLSDFDAWIGLEAPIEVKVNGCPEPEVKWTKDGQPVAASNHIKIEKDGKTHRIMIKESAATDSGVYSCTIKNKIGENKTECKLRVKTPEDANEPVCVKQLAETVSVRYSPATFEAKILGNPKPDIVWKKDGKDLAEGERIHLVEEPDKFLYRLTVEKTNVPDMGKYSIHASNGHGKTSSEASLDVKVPPEFEVPMDRQIMPKGTTTYEVTVTGRPQPAVTWCRNGKPLPAGPKFSWTGDDKKQKYVLTITEADLEDAGIYEVLAENMVGKEKKSFNLLITTDQPKFTQVIESILVKPMKMAQFDTAVDGIPIPGVKWFRNGNELSANYRISFVQNDERSHSLKIDEFCAEDVGDYECQAISKAGMASCKARLDVLHTMPFFPKHVPKETCAIDGENFTLEAKVDGSPHPSVKWLKDGKPVEASDRIKMVVLPDGTCKLTVDNAKAADCGKYTLVATNETGELSSTGVVNVEAVPKGPSITEKLKKTTVHEGSPLQLTARITGYPRPAIKWFKDGKPVKLDRCSLAEKPDGSVTLVIDEAKPDDAGKYSLQVKNNLGEASSEAEVRVQSPPQAPYFPIKLRHMDVYEGYPIRLEGKVGGYPLPALKWLKNGSELKPDGERIIASLQPDGILCLTVNSVKAEDSGKYTCVATNSEGEATTFSDVAVLTRTKAGEPIVAPSFITPLKDTILEENLPLKLQAHVAGNPVPEVFWNKDGQPLKTDDRMLIVFDGERVSIDIKKVITGDAGKYECTLENKEGKATSVSDVKIKKVSKAPVFTQRFPDLTVILAQDARFVCRAIGLPNPDITWYHNDKALAESDRYKMKHEGDMFALYVRDCTTKDIGNITCRASNIDGEEKCTAFLNVVDKLDKKEKTEAPSFLKKLADAEVIEGMGGKFTACVSGYPEPEFKWYKDGRELTQTEKLKFEVDAHGLLRLILKNVQPQDVGKYKLRLINPHGEAECEASLRVESHEKKVKKPMADYNADFEKIKRSGVPFALPDKPIISKMTDRRLTLSWKPSIPVGPRVPVTYIVEMCEQPDGDWFNVRTGVRSCCCEIHNLEPFRDYKFRIRVENKYGISDPSPYATAYRTKLEMTPPKYLPTLPSELDFRPETSQYFPKDYDPDKSIHEAYAHAPKFLRQASDTQYGVKNQPSNVQWFVYGFPMPTITWYFGEEKIEMGGRYDSAFARNAQATLFINRMLERDVGIYECVAINEHGEARQRVHVEIAEAPMFNMQLEETTVLLRDKCILQCRVVGMPYPEIKWYKDWHPLADSSRTKIEWREPDLCTLTISDTISKDAGLYSCAARNLAGMSSNSVMVTIEENEGDYSILTYNRNRVVKARHKPFEDMYDIGDELGRGTQGIIYHAVERATGNSLAAKIMHGKGELRDAMDRELDIMNQLHSRHLIRAIDAFDTKKGLTLVTELAAGGELLDSLCKQSTLKESDIAMYIRQVLWGLDHMHNKGIAHLGLTPGDLLLSKPGGDDIKICDYGLARRLIKGQDAYLDFGMPEFVAPEVANRKPISFHTDMWSVGVITYLLLSGISPFLGDHDRQTLQQVQQGRLNFDQDVFTHISAEAKDFMSKLLVFEASGRLDVKNALKHPWLKWADRPGAGESYSTESLKSYYRRYKEWCSNSACKRFYRRRPLESAFTHPSRMVYPPDEQYTPASSPEPSPTIRTKGLPTFKDKVDREHENYDLGFADSQSRYQAGPDTYLLQLRDVGFPLRLREYMRVGATTSPMLGFRLMDTMLGKAVTVRERRRFTDVMDEEIDEEKKGICDSTQRRITSEVAPRSETKNRIKELMPYKQEDGQSPFFREKLQDQAIVEDQPTDVSCFVIGDPKPNVTWYRNDVILSETHRIKFVETPEGRTVLRFAPSKAFDAGIYKAVARNAAGESSCRARLRLGDVPGRPDAPEVSKVSDTEALLKWTKPKDTGNSTIGCYELEYKEKESNEWKIVSSAVDHDFFVVRGLKPRTLYHYRIRAQNKFGFGEFSVPSASTRTMDDGVEKINVSIAMKHLQEITEAGRTIDYTDTEQKTIRNYNVEQEPIALTQGSPTEKYSFVAEIARGQFSALVKASKTEGDVRCAAKIIDASKPDARAQQEVETMRGLCHERLPVLFEAFHHNNMYILVMEKLQGYNVLTFLTQRHEYSEDLVARMVTQVLDALQYLHTRRTIHLDLQPDNIVVSNLQQGDFKLVDLGSAHKIGRNCSAVLETKTGLLDYRAPEIITGEEATCQADLWSLGVLTYILLSGVSPFVGNDDKETCENITYARYRFDNLFKEVTSEATRFIMLLFKKTPAKRPTADECLECIKWLNPSDVMLKKRQRAIFLSSRLKTYADEYHRKRSQRPSCADTLLGSFCEKFGRSASIECDAPTTF